MYKFEFIYYDSSSQIPNLNPLNLKDSSTILHWIQNKQKLMKNGMYTHSHRWHSILILEGIIKKISYKRRDYESVDEKDPIFRQYKG